MSRRELRERLAATRGRKYDTPQLGLQDLADILGIMRAPLDSFVRGAQELSVDNQHRLSHVLRRIDRGELAKERDGGGRWVLRPVRNQALAQVAAAPGQKMIQINLTEAGPRLKL